MENDINSKKNKIENDPANNSINNPENNSINNQDNSTHNFFEAYEIHVSVRQLVEFIMRGGDIDNRRTSSVEDSMQEGGRLHRMIQRSMGDNYYPEVLLRYRYQTDRYDIAIEGRADGIILDGWDEDDGLNSKIMDGQLSLNQHPEYVDFQQVTIDEIKCIGRKLEYLSKPVDVHLAQAKVYAYIYATQKKLPLIRVRMSYCHFETEEMKYFIEEYTYEEISAWFEDLMAQYVKWADFQYEWNITSVESMKKLVFPFPYREGQRNLAVYVYRTIQEGKKFFLEAPTGVGKTITTIFPSIKSMGEGLTKKIFYLTAKTITRTVAEETFDLLRKQNLRMKTLTLTAKEKICFQEKTECNPSACPFAQGHFDRVNDAIYDVLIHEDKIDRTIIEQYAKKYQVCPFEFGLDVSLFADAIICDYNYVFDPHANLKRFFSEGVKEDYVFLIDEAHNLVERGREMFSASLYKEDFLELRRELNDVIEHQPLTKALKRPSNALRLVKALERCNKELLQLKRQCENCLVLESADPFVRLVESLYQSMDEFLEDETVNDSHKEHHLAKNSDAKDILPKTSGEKDIRQKVLEFYFEISHFLMIYEKLDENYCIYCELQEDDRFLIRLFCVNPRVNLKEAMGKGRSSILFSATLLPIQYYKDLLGGDKDDYEAYAKSTFLPEKRGLYIANDVTSKYTRRNEMEYHKIASYIFEVVTAKPGNYMVFFPSYQFLNKVFESFQESFYEEDHMLCVCQEEYMNEQMREAFLKLFSGECEVPENLQLPGKVSPKVKGHVPESLIGFCVLGGIFSEGIDLKEDSLIGSIIVGTGLPQICNEKELLKDHFDEKNNGFDYAYRYPGMNKVLQAAGRVIRTMEDVGVVVLLDERFLGNSYRRMFPREWENYEVVSNSTISECLDNFWTKNKK